MDLKIAPAADLMDALRQMKDRVRDAEVALANHPRLLAKRIEEIQAQYVDVLAEVARRRQERNAR